MFTNIKVTNSLEQVNIGIPGIRTSNWVLTKLECTNIKFLTYKIIKSGMKILVKE